MKIQVGKTYNDTAGNSWLVECRLTNPNRQKQPYVCTGLNGYHNTCYLDENGCSSGGGIKLVPIKVKKEGWINLWRMPNGDVVPGAALFSTPSAAEYSASKTPTPSNRVATIRIVWEEEE
jgi:hypothetical protein